MKNKFVKDILEAQKLSLSKGEKSQMRDSLEQFMSENPVRISSLERLKLQSNIFNLRKDSMAAAILTVTFIAAVGLLAAGTALPGSLLYPVKRHINEQAGNLTAISQESQAETDTNIVGERILELEQLAINGSLNTENREYIESNFSNAIENFEKVIANMQNEHKSEAALEASSNLAATLASHKTMLEEIMATYPGSSKEIQPFLSKLNKEKEELESSESEVGKSISEKTDEGFKNAAEGKLKAAEHKISITRNFIEKAKVSEETQAVGLAKLTEAESLVDAGKTELGAGNYGKAFLAFKDAHKTAQEAKTTVQTGEKLNIELGTATSKKKQESAPSSEAVIPSANGAKNNQNGNSSNGNGQVKGDVDNKNNNKGGLKLEDLKLR